MTFLINLCLFFFAFVNTGILAGETAPIPDCGSFEAVCCDGEITDQGPSIGDIVSGCSQYAKIKKCEHPETWWCCSSFMPPPGKDTGVALGCAEAWPDHVLCPSLPNRKAKRRPGNLNKRNKCDDRMIHDFIQKLPSPSIPMVPGIAPGVPVFVPINYEQPPSVPIEPFLTTTPITTTSSQVEAPAPLSGSGLLASSNVDTAAGQQPPSGSSYLPFSDEDFLSQLSSSSSLDSSSNSGW